MSNNLPPGWAWTTVGDLSNVEYGKGLSKKQRVQSGAIEVYGSAGLAGHHDQALVEEPVIVVGRKGNAGAVWLTNRPSWPIDTTYFLRPPQGLLSDFLALQLGHQDLVGLDSSTTIPSLRRPDLEASPVAIAPVLEQKRIVAAIEEHFSRLDAAEATLRQTLQRLDTLRVSTLTDAFHANREPPNGWRNLRLENLLEHSIGGLWGSPAGEDEHDVDVIRVTELKDHGTLSMRTAARRSITKRQLSSRLLRVGDLVLEKSGGGPTTPVGRVARFPGHTRDAICTNFMQLMRPSSELVESRFLHWQLHYRYVSGATATLNKGSGNIRNLHTKEYLRQPVTLPPIDEQVQISRGVEEFFAQARELERAVKGALARLAGLRRSLLAAAFSGRLVPQDPDDEPASVLLERITASRPPKPARRRMRS